MIVSRSVAKLVLTAHVVASVGWLGAVLAYLAFDVTAAISNQVPILRAAYFAMNLIIIYTIVPLAVASVLIGIVNAVVSRWGLLQHYWVVVKLLLTLFATAILLLEVQNVSYMAEVAASGADPHKLPGSLPHSIGGLIVLLVTTVLSVYKPRGMTRYGWRISRREHQ